jgi:5'-AMP-activated protein kinase catalytic alpha subunit
MIKGKKYKAIKIDIWSSGIILYVMLCGFLPFNDEKNDILYKKIVKGEFFLPKFLSQNAKDLITKILSVDPDLRINIVDIKKHSWFNLIKPHLVKGINLEEDIIPVDDKILDMVKSYGFDPEECRSLLLKNKFCSLTTIYYLCLKKYIKENGKSISDLESDLFEEYINNPKNKIKKNNKKEDQKNNKTDIKKTDRHISPGKRLTIKKMNTTKTNRNNFFKVKRNGTPTLNCIKISSDKRNLKSTKNIKRGYILTENTNANTNISSNLNFSTNPNYNKEKINCTRIESIKEVTDSIENIKGKNNKKNNLLSENNNLNKNQQKNMNATKNNLKKKEKLM